MKEDSLRNKLVEALKKVNATPSSSQQTMHTETWKQCLCLRKYYNINKKNASNGRQQLLII